jgi:hypothetical protein
MRLIQLFMNVKKSGLKFFIAHLHIFLYWHLASLVYIMVASKRLRGLVPYGSLNILCLKLTKQKEVKNNLKNIKILVKISV